MKQIELLAPAGSMESLKAAVGAGCDAVYLGGSQFGARAYADNPEKELLLQAIDYMNLRGKQLYLTVNTLIKTEEMEQQLYDFLYPYYRQGLSAVIVQDVGAIRLIHREFPELPIHASTQMTLTMAEGGMLLSDFGVTRLVMARELTLEELKRVRASTCLELETFVHGALCYCYSGQCLMSSMIGGRSGNRGRCAQPCRMEYQITEPGSKRQAGYLLSPKDMCTLSLIPELADAGINSFKIEGRMKRYEYVAGVTAAYRKQLERYYELGTEGFYNYHRTHPGELPAELQKLQELYNRGGFHTGYYKEHNGSAMMSMLRPNHSGVLVGSVKSVCKNQAELILKETLWPGDVLEFRRQGNCLYEFTVKDCVTKKVYTAKFTPGSKVEQGCEVYRTKHPKLLSELSEQYYKTEVKLPVIAEVTAACGKALRFTVSLEQMPEWKVTVSGTVCQRAEKQPVSQERILTELKKMGDTSFRMNHAVIDLEEAVFFPMSSLKELRREAISNLETAILSRFHREIKTEKAINQSQGKADAKDAKQQERIPKKAFQQPVQQINASVISIEQLEVVCKSSQIADIYLELTDLNLKIIPDAAKITACAGKRLFLALPHIFRARTYDRYTKQSQLLFSEEIAGYLIRTLEELYFLKRQFAEESKSKELRLDYMLYVMNQEAKAFFSQMGADRMTAPVELNARELEQLDISEMELIIYGRLPLMVSAQCVRKNLFGCQKKNSEIRNIRTEPIWITDRTKKRLPAVSHCNDCFSTIYNPDLFSICGAGFKKEIQRLHPASVRLNFTLETKAEIVQLLQGLEKGAEEAILLPEGSKATRGHFRRGIQ